ncbi:MAG: hypothetical protein M1817_002066 [Caeruleum heppii]|nr:MAG: hypothetical protein M1817_002066 [Caeruleum heppii]
MEAAPLTHAHAHVRAASSSHVSSITAVEQHELAAGEFSKATAGIGDLEALRTLRLLEQHHRKLSEILRFRSAHPSQQASAPNVTAKLEEDVAAEADDSTKAASTAAKDRTSSPPPAPHPPALPHASRPSPRDLSSSIASNLASARGIPSGPRRRGSPASPAVSTQHAGGRLIGSPDRQRHGVRADRRQSPGRVNTALRSERNAFRANDSVDMSLKKPTVPANPFPSEKPKEQPGQSDEGFQRFYSTFEGLLSKLSAPLAFAGLPLSSEEPPAAPKKTEASTGVTTEPDFTKIYSRAALRAVKEGLGQTAGGDSFYVVPTTGGTISYARMLARDEQERDDEFFDAPQSPSNVSSKNRGGKTREELELENSALKHLSDTLSRRLHMWELNAQSSSMALHQSIRAMHQSPTTSDAGKDGELEEQLRTATRELERMNKENEKLRGVVGRYRDKWEKLKEGARMRREGGKTEDTGEE